MSRMEAREIEHRRKARDVRRHSYLQSMGKFKDTATYDARQRFKTPSYYQREAKKHEETED